MEALILNAKSRDARGTRAKDVREQKQIPAVVYGHGVEARAISVSVAEFRKVFAKAGSSALVDVVVDGSAAVKAIIHEVQPHHLGVRAVGADAHLPRDRADRPV